MILYSILFAALCFAAPVRRLLQEEGEVALGGGWAPSRDVTTDEIALWESAMTNTEGLYQGTDLEAIGEPVSVETQVVAGTNYKFTFEDGTTVTVYECPWEDILEVTDVSAAPSDSQNLFGGSGSIGPAWTYDDSVEQPAGTKDMGGWTAAVYTEEQQERLGVDELGVSTENTADMNGVKMMDTNKAEQEIENSNLLAGLRSSLLNRWAGPIALAPGPVMLGANGHGLPPTTTEKAASSLRLGRSGSIGPRWTFDNSVEKPAGTKDMGDYTISVYTPEQQERLNVNELGEPSQNNNIGGLAGTGPSWTYDASLEAPAGEKDMGGWTKAVYTPEQQERLGVDEDGNSETTVKSFRANVQAVRATLRMFNQVFRP